MWGFPGGASGKEPTCQCRRNKSLGFNLWVKKIPWRRAWQPTPVFLPGEFQWTESLAPIVHKVAKNWTLLKWPTEKAMAPHSSTLAWKIPWMEEPGRLQSMGPLRVGHDWATSLSLFTFVHWRRKWQPTPVFLPGESQGQGSLVGCRQWGHTESDMTEAT